MPSDRDALRSARGPPALARGNGYDEIRRKHLARNKLLATALLGVMAAVYVVTLTIPHPGFVTLFVRAGAEAGIVGGLADWFAVTALFRHPLGLPIPHTAIIPANQARLAQALSRFVERNFLTREVLVRKLRDAELSRHAADWLAGPKAAPVVAGWVIAALPQLVRAIENPELLEFIDRALGDQLRRADLSPLLGRLLQAFTASGEADALFDSAADAAVRWIEQHQGLIETIVQERSRWWVPKAINRMIANGILRGATELLQGVREPGSDARARFKGALSEFVDGLVSSPERRMKVNLAKERLLAHPEVRAWLAAAWRELSQSELPGLVQPGSKARAALERAISSIGRILASDATMLAHIDHALERIAIAMVARRSDIAGVIAEVVRGWDTQTLIDRLELAVGRDLQYIRMNGTLVGAGVGASIFIVSRLLGL